MNDLMLANNPQIRFWISVSRKYRLHHPLPTYNVSQDENLKGKTYGCGVACRKIKQADGSRFMVYREAIKKMGRKRKGDLVNETIVASPIDFGRKVQRLVFPEYEFWFEKIVSLQELERFLKNRQGAKLSYVLYVVNQFVDSIRVVPLLIDWQEQYFFDLSFSFSQCRSPDGFGVLMRDASSFNDMNLIGVKGFTVIEYLADIRMCLCCGGRYNARKGREEKMLSGSSLFGVS